MKVTEEIRDYIRLIDSKYAEAKAKRISRLDPEWGKWSTEMNRETKAKTQTGKHPQEVLLKYVYIYWVNRSQLLELHKSKWRKKALKIKLAREGRKIRKLILSGDIPAVPAFIRSNIILDSLSKNK